MALSKNPKFDLKLKWGRIFEIGLIFSLALLILAFKYFPELEKEKSNLIVPEDVISMDDIPQTVHEQKKIPPKMPTFIMAPDDEEGLVDPEIPTELIDIGTIIESVPPQITDEEEEEDEPWIFRPVQNPPEIIGGIEAILKNLDYPELAKRANIEGMVVIYAYVDEKGNVAKVEIAKDLGAGCGQAAAEAVMKVRFKPGKQRGNAVKCRVAVPVRFRLN